MDTGRPDESTAQRLDRNHGEILQELRVAQTGVQLLFGFLLTVPFQARFSEVDGWQRNAMVLALILAALATAFLIAPVSYHRILFRQQMKDEVVKAANRFAQLGLACLLLAIVVALDLVLDVVVGRVWALVASGGILVVLVTVWYVFPLWELRLERAERNGELPERRSVGDPPATT